MCLVEYDLCFKVRIVFAIVREMPMDPLSDVLSLLKPQSYMSAGFDAGGEWAVQFPDQQQSIKCGAVVSGACWVSVAEVPDPVYLDTGDSFLLPSGRPFRFASDLSVARLVRAEEPKCGQLPEKEERTAGEKKNPVRDAETVVQVLVVSNEWLVAR